VRDDPDSARVVEHREAVEARRHDWPSERDRLVEGGEAMSDEGFRWSRFAPPALAWVLGIPAFWALVAWFCFWR